VRHPAVFFSRRHATVRLTPTVDYSLVMDGVLERRNDQHTRRIVPFPVSIGATIKIVGDHVSGANQCQKTERNCAKISVRSHSPLLALVHAACA